MHLTRVKIHNFMFIENTDIELTNDLYLVMGENHDDISSSSNGAGKSMFCEALMWCLFGELIRKNTVKDDVIGIFDKYTEVTLDLFAASHTFQVTRYRKHPEHNNKLIVSVDGEPIAKHLQSESQDFLNRNLGVNEATAFQTMYSGQDGEDPFIKQSPANMLKTIIKIFQLGELDKFEKASKSHRTTLKNNLISQYDKVESSIKQLEILKSNSPDNKQFIENRFNSNLSTLQEDLVSLNIRAELLLEDEENNSLSEEELEEIESLSKDLEAINSIKVKVNKIQEKIDEYKKQLRLNESKLEACNNTITSNKDIINNLIHNPSGHCGYCGNDIIHSAFTKKKIDEAQDEIDKTVIQSSLYSGKINEIKKVLILNENEKQELSITLDSAQDMIVKWKELTSKKSKHESIVRQASIIISQIEDIEIKKIPHLKRQYDEDLRTLDIKHRDYQKQMKTLELSLDMEQKKYDSISHQIKLVDKLVTMCQSIKESRFNSVMQTLKSKIDYNLEQLTNGDTTCVLDYDQEKFRLLFQKRTEDQPKTFHQLSKGERAKVQRVIYDSFTDIINVPFIIDDEGLDGLDDSGTVSVLDYMSNRNPNNTLLFVAHQQSVKDYFTSRPTIKVVRKNNKCLISVEK